MRFRVMRAGTFFSLAFLVIAAANLFSANVVGRESILRDGEWYFLPRLSDRGEGQRLKLESGEALRQSWRRIDVPSCWQKKFDDLRYFEGVAWYSRISSTLEIQVFDMRAWFSRGGTTLAGSI